MFRRNVTLIAILALVSGVALRSTTSTLATAGDLLWEDVLASPGGEVSSTLQTGRLFVAGIVTNESGNRDCLVRAHDAKTGTFFLARPV